MDGLALGMAGNITREWAVFANYTFLDSKVLQNAADEAASDPVKGRELTQTPRHGVVSLWTTYALGDWTFGYGTTYQGSFYPNNANEAVYRKTDAYWVHRAMIGYQINERIGLQLNVSNLFDEEYYTGIRNNLTVDAAGRGHRRQRLGQSRRRPLGGADGHAPLRGGIARTLSMHNGQGAPFEVIDMLLAIPEVLTPEQVAQARAQLDAANWADGRITAGYQSAKAKDNAQLPEDSPAARDVGAMVLDALARNSTFFSAALPKRIYPPLFNRYDGGQSFGYHVDNAVRYDRSRGGVDPVRTDLSATLFLSAPEDYDGGELVIERAPSAHSAREASRRPHGVLHPGTSLHKARR